MTEPQLSFGLIGTGYWARTIHGPGLRSSASASLRGVWGRDERKAEEVADELGVTAYSDLDALLEAVDAVAIAVSPDAQPELAIRAAQAGCHLLLDKPLAVDVGPAEKVVAAAKEHGVESVLFFTRRFLPEAERWIQETATLRPWHSAYLVMYANIYQAGSAYENSAWRKKYGALWDVGPHALALLWPAMGPVRTVSARPGPIGTDTVHLLLGHEPSPVGGTSLISLSLTIPVGAVGTELVLYGERGVLRSPPLAWDPHEAFENAVSELVLNVQGSAAGRHLDVGFGLEVVRVLDAARRALELPTASP